MLRKRGATLIELLIYVAIAGLFLTAAVQFAWSSILTSKKGAYQREVVQNGRIVTETIGRELRSATNFSLTSSQAICITTTNPNKNPVAIYLESEAVLYGWGGTADCSNLESSYPLTSSIVLVDQLSFTELSETGTTSLQYLLTVSSKTDNPRWQHTFTTQTSTTLKISP